MRAGVWNLLFGLVAIAAGASGQFALPFTKGPIPLVIAGAVVAGLGTFQLIRSRGR